MERKIERMANAVSKLEKSTVSVADACILLGKQCDEREDAIRCINSLLDNDLIHHVMVVARTLASIQRERKEVIE